MQSHDDRPSAALRLSSGEYAPRVLLGLALLVVACSALGLWIGAADLGDPQLRDALLQLRAQRLAGALLTGAALATAGAVVQGLFRNPLADPSLLGTTAGASLGGQTALLLHQLLATTAFGVLLPAPVVLPLGCLVGALLALLVLLAITRRHQDLVLLLLTGFILTSLLLALGNLVMSLSQEKWELGRAMVAFVLGGLSGTSGAQVAMAAPLVTAGLLASWLWSRPLDLLLSGEDEAASLGVDVVVARRWTVVWSATLVGAAVSLGGNIGFVGLVVPHGLRMLVGAEHRRLIPASALGGAAFVAGCDVLARAVPARTELPLGVVTGLFGAPLFLALLLRTWRGGTRG